MSFMTNYRKALKKHKKESEESTQTTTAGTSGSSFMDNYRAAKEKYTAQQEEVEIAPVLEHIRSRTPKKNDEDKEKWYDGFLQLGDALSDGWQFGDVAKTLLGTDTDILTNSISGVVGWGEDAIDAGATAIGTLAEKAGWDQAAQKLRDFTKQELYDEKETARKILKGGPVVAPLLPPGLNNIAQAASGIIRLDDWINSKEVDNGFGGSTTVRADNSLLGDQADSLIQSVGEVIAKKGLQAAAGGIPVADIITGVTVYGEQAEQALREDATFGEATGSGLISAAAEIMFEKLSGGVKFGGVTLDEGLTRLVSKNISNVALKNLAHLALSVPGESLEELATEFVGKLGTSLYKEEDLADILFSEESLNDYIRASFAGGLMGGSFSGYDAVTSTARGRDAKTGLSKNEQKVLNKVYKDLVAEESKNGKVTQAKKNELYDQAVAAMDKGYITTDTIEEVLGGEDFKAYQTAQEKENSVLKELEGLYQGEELAAQQQSIRDNSTLSQLRQTMGEKVAELVKGDRLAESYREKGRRSQMFQADLSRYNEKQRAIVQKAIDSGVLNNTNRSHELVDLIAKVGADKALDFDFTNNEKLKESGFALNGKSVNGYLSGSGVTVNINSAKALNSVVGHEITHVLEGAGEFYTALESMVTEIAKAKGEYNSRLTELRSLYADVDGYKGADGHEKIKKELVADLVGDYIFTDTDFINRLSTENRNLFEKIYDELKYLCRVATAGSKEARQLEKAKKAFEDAYRQDTKNTADDGGVRYSLMAFEKDGRRFVEIDQDQDRFDGHSADEYPAIAKEIIKEKFENKVVGIDNKMFVNGAGRSEYAYPSKPIADASIYEAKMRASSELDNLLDAGTNYRNEPDGKDGHTHPDVVGGFDYFDTLFKIGNRYFEARINIKNIKRGKLFTDVTQIKDVTQAIMSSYGQNPKSQFLRTSSMDSIRSDEGKVNKKMSLSAKEDKFPVRKDLEAVRGKIYGSDVELRELGPVRQDIQADKAAQDPYDDLPFDMPENLEDGQLSDAELEEDARRNPITTVAQRLKVKFASLRQELQSNEQNRQASADAYDQRIAELQQRYDAKPKKHTKAANAILRQIDKQKQLKAQRDAEFEKRINDIKKKIDKTRELMKWDHTREDLLEKQLRQVDEKLEADKQALEEEFRERRAQAESLADKGSYFSREARILYDEIINHKKGTRFSDDIGELLDAGHSFPQIKSALLMVEKHPGQARYRGWAVEQDIRAILERNYGNAVYETDQIDKEYQERLTELEKQAKEDRESYSVSAQRKHKQQQYDQQMEELLGDTSTWKDKKLGIQYQIDTLRRNLRDVVRDEKGNRDIAKADAIWDELQGKYNHNEAELKRESARIKQAYADMKITKAEDVYIQMLGEFRHNPDTQLSLETVEGFYEEHKDEINTEKVDKAIELARQTYDELLQRVNTVLREQGMREIPYRKGYFPHFTEEAKGRFRMFLEKVLNFKYKGDEIPTDIAGMTETFTPNRSYQRFNKQRTSDLTAYSFTKGMDSYVHGALDWIYHIEDIQKRRALENHIRYIHSDEAKQARINEAKNNDMWDADQVQEEIDKILKEANNPLNNFVTDLHTGTNILAGKKNTMDRGMENATNRAVYSIMTSLSSRINANMVAGSVSSALTNFIPITQSWGEVSPKSSLRAMAETIMSYVSDDGTVNKSDFLTNRLRPEDNLHKTGWDKVSDKVGWLMEKVDDFTSQTIWRSKYQENLSNGMSEAEAIKNADEFAEGVMAGRSRGNMPTLFDAKNPVARVLTAFQLEVNNQYGYMLKDMPQNLQTEVKGKLVAGYAKMFIGAYAYNALYSLLTGRNAAFDPIRIIQELMGDIFPDEDEEEKKPSEIVSNLAENVLEELPFIGGLMGGGRIPISSALPYGEGPVEMITGTMQDIENRDIANLTWEWLNPAFYLIAPVGGGQARKTAQGLSMFLGDKPVSGSYTSSGNLRFPVEETPLNIAQAAIFGQWANENAQKYIDEGRSPIAESQIQDYLDSGLTYEAWWERKDELKKVDNDFEANESIMAFRQVIEQVEDIAAAPVAKDEDILREKFMRSAADELSDIKAEMKELVITPVAQIYKERKMKMLQEQANNIAQSAMDAYSKVRFDGDYARVGEKVWKHDEDGQWRRLTGEALTKYEVTSAAGDADYATDGTVQYYRTDDGWKKLTDEQIEKQDAVTAALGITPEAYWGDKREEYNFAYEKPEKYLLTKAIGGYDAYKAYNDKLNDIKADKDKDGKSISGSRKEKVIKYINGLDIPYGEKLIIFKNEYPADDTYNQKIVDYLYSLDDLTEKEVETILKELDFKVSTDGKVTW